MDKKQEIIQAEIWMVEAKNEGDFDRAMYWSLFLMRTQLTAISWQLKLLNDRP
jgi:hypothetical protein